jgi:hypothetical protein
MDDTLIKESKIDNSDLKKDAGLDKKNSRA